MQDFKNPFEELGFSLEQEIQKEKELATILENPEDLEDIKSTVIQFKDLAENSKNNRTVPIIQKCAEIINEGFVCPKFKEEIAESISKELFPVLYNNIINNKEKIEPNDLLEMIFALYDTKNHTLKQNVQDLLLYLIDPNTKNILLNMINERTRQES